MKRNLESRVEVITPVEDPLDAQDLRVILDTQLNTKRGAWELKSDGTYTRCSQRPTIPVQARRRY